MKLSRASNYAVLAVAHLARLPPGRFAPSHLVARDEGIPDRFLLKVLRPLAGAGILVSVKGPNGGYRLARPARGISLLEIVEAVDGPIQGQAPAFGGDAVIDRRLQAACDRAAEAARKHLAEVSVADLGGRRK